MKTGGKFGFETIYKNRYLMFLCMVLIFGSVFGTSVLKILPDTVCKNIFDFISHESDGILQIFMNRFSLSFVCLFAVYLCGFSILGGITVPTVVFINGFFYGFENALKYMNLGNGYISDSLVLYITLTLYSGFMLIIMSENSIFFSKIIKNQFKDNASEKPHYNAKKHTVKFITFTGFLALFSAFSSYFLLFIQNRF